MPLTRLAPARRHLVLMLVITFSTGMIDAAGYMGLDRVFTANMTGNIVILGMALTGARDLPIVGPLIALIAFVIGAAVAGRVLRHTRGGWSGRTTTMFSVAAGIVLATGIASLVEHPVEHTPWGLSVTGALGLAMGAQAACARHLGVKDVTTVVVTSTLTGFAADSRLAGGSGENWARRLLALVLMLAGAAAGAGILLLASFGASLVVAGGIVLVAALMGHASRRAE
ncbi:YoaK family protein [Microbacterium sp.]|uniref:YoaK family protein n=1 Tax=Microbacterium TaxID=33882 RepID=UPI003F98F80A